MSVHSEKKLKRERRHRRVRAKIKGTAERPRLSVFRSNKHISAQLIDDDIAKTLVSSADWEISPKKLKKGEKLGILAARVGEDLAQKAKKLSILAAVFDRGGYAYHGAVKALAEGARKGGLRF